MSTHKLVRYLGYPVLALLAAIAMACGPKPTSTQPAMPESTSTQPATPTPTSAVSPSLPTYTPIPTDTYLPAHTSAPTRTTRPPAPTTTPTSTTTSASTSTSTAVQTPTPVQSPTLAKIPTPVPEPVTPVLLEPFAGTMQGIPITFRWDGPLNAGEAFQVTVQHTESGKRIQTSPMTEREWAVDLPKDLVGEWRWTVWLVKGDELLRISDEWHFYFDPHEGPGPRPTPEPTKALPTKAVSTATRIPPTPTRTPGLVTRTPRATPTRIPPTPTPKPVTPSPQALVGWATPKPD